MDLRKKSVVATLVLLIRDGKVLLALKTKKIGVGLWNGWGGMVEPGETIRQCAVRELFEESGLIALPEDLKYTGKVIFHGYKSDDRKIEVECHIFLLLEWSGELKLNSEMKNPTFWPITNVPYGQMMGGDKDWLSPILDGKLVEAEVWHLPGFTGLERPIVVNIVEALGDID